MPSGRRRVGPAAGSVPPELRASPGRRAARRGWQVLNVVRRGPATVAGIGDAVRPFLAHGEATAGVVDDLRAAGWVTTDGAHHGLASGRAAAFDQLLEQVSADRRTMVDGVAPADLATTAAVLERMARNLGWTPA